MCLPEGEEISFCPSSHCVPELSVKDLLSEGLFHNLSYCACEKKINQRYATARQTFVVALVA